MLNKTTEIVPRASVESIVAHRDRALNLYGKAHDAMLIAAEAIAAANDAGRMAAPRVNSFNSDNEASRRHLLEGVKVPERDIYLADVRKVTDTSVWAHVIEMTDLEMVMDKKAKQQFRTQLNENPPEVTVENIYATLETFLADAGTIFRRGIANCFSALDRRFKSHDGFKIGGRVILDRMYDEHGFMNYHRDMESTLVDIERTFSIIDGGKVPASYTSIVGQLKSSRYTGSGARQGEVENEYFTVRVFKNGNCHVWFRRDDLVEKVNKLLAEYYGAVVPDGMEPEDDGGLNTPKTSLAKNYGFFPTPDDAAKRLIDDANLKGKTVLEPSAGTGNLARAAAAQGATVDCIEIHPERAAVLKGDKTYRWVCCADFLTMQPSGNELYDVVLMNPPFDRERDIDHVMHAIKFLKPDGMLLAIMSAGTEFRETRKSVAFRAHIEKMHGHFSDLPEGSFASVGTNINTVILKVYKDGRTFWR